jgi:hypothetical protein
LNPFAAPSPGAHSFVPSTPIAYQPDNRGVFNANIPGSSVNVEHLAAEINCIKRILNGLVGRVESISAIMHEMREEYRSAFPSDIVQFASTDLGTSIYTDFKRLLSFQQFFEGYNEVEMYAKVEHHIPPRSRTMQTQHHCQRYLMKNYSEKRRKFLQQMGRESKDRSDFAFLQGYKSLTTGTSVMGRVLESTEEQQTIMHYINVLSYALQESKVLDRVQFSTKYGSQESTQPFDHFNSLLRLYPATHLGASQLHDAMLLL